MSPKDNSSEHRALAVWRETPSIQKFGYSCTYEKLHSLMSLYPSALCSCRATKVCKRIIYQKNTIFICAEEIQFSYYTVDCKPELKELKNVLAGCLSSN